MVGREPHRLAELTLEPQAVRPKLGARGWKRRLLRRHVPAGRKDSPSNVRQRLFVKAIERANLRLAELGIEQLGDVRPHGLRRTFASQRTACGDDPVFVSRQIGHTDVRFTLNVYAQSVKRRERMTAAEQHEYDLAVEWASWATETAPLGTSAQSTAAVSASDEVASYQESGSTQALR